jgi:hypothetical protein
MPQQSQLRYTSCMLVADYAEWLGDSADLDAGARQLLAPLLQLLTANLQSPIAAGGRCGLWQCCFAAECSGSLLVAGWWWLGERWAGEQVAACMCMLPKYVQRQHAHPTTSARPQRQAPSAPPSIQAPPLRASERCARAAGATWAAACSRCLRCTRPSAAAAAQRRQGRSLLQVGPPLPPEPRCARCSRVRPPPPPAGPHPIRSTPQQTTPLIRPPPAEGVLLRLLR